MSRLDRSRPYGSIYPQTRTQAYVQDDIIYGVDGVAFADTELLPPPRVQPVGKNAPSTGGVFVSAVETQPPPQPVAVAVVTNEPTPPSSSPLSPLSVADWETMDFRRLQKAIVGAFSVQVPNRKHALKLLREKGLIKGV